MITRFQIGHFFFFLSKSSTARKLALKCLESSQMMIFSVCSCACGIDERVQDATHTKCSTFCTTWISAIVLQIQPAHKHRNSFMNQDECVFIFRLEHCDVRAEQIYWLVRTMDSMLVSCMFIPTYKTSDK